MKHVTALLGLLLAVAAVGCAGPQQVAAPTADADEKKDDTFAEATKSSRALDGLFTVYQDTTSGALQLAIRPDQLDREYIYFTHVADGVPRGGHFRGQFRDNAVFSIRRHFNKVEFVQENTAFHFDEGNALARAAEANLSPAVLAVQEIVAEHDSTGVLLIKADDLFLTEALAWVKPPSKPGQPPTAFSLGSLAKDKTHVVAVHNYPENTDVVVRYVYDHPGPLNGGGPEVTDARSVAVTLQHTLLAMPENDYAPLYDDPRVGYFTQQVTDLTSPSPTPYRDLVRRWHLQKADPEAAVSEPVEPLVWWIENTTPVEYRDTIRRAVLAWNEAFEAAGLKDALVVKVQPDDAEWDAGDIRYNVLRWTSSPTPPFGGYGPSFANPRTGQLLGADIMLEYVFVTNRLAQDKLFETAALHLEQAEAMAALAAGPDGLDPQFCSLGHHLHAQTLFGLHALGAAGATEAEVRTYIEHSLYYLLLHEVGHTLGLNHNMRASQMLSPAETADWALTMERGLTGSVMDYPASNVAAPGQPQGAYFTTKPGPYDVWAIQFGYGDLTDAEREALLARSTEPELAFGNDADDMRWPGKAIDPRVMIGDMSSDAVGYAEGRLALVDEVMAGLLEKYATPGRSYHELRNAYLILTGQIASAVNVASRYVGGVYVDRAMAGQPGATQPFTPVAREDQERAMDLLARRLFAPDAFDAPEGLYNHLAMQRRGFNFFGDSEDPKLHERALAIQGGVLAHLLHPSTMQRITDARLYGNDYPLAEMVADLTDAVFAADAAGDVNSFRQNLQLEYVNRLAAIVEDEDDQYDHVSQSQALAQLRRIEALLEAKRDGRAAGNAETQAHTAHVLYVIEQALDAE
ncbi:MAG: zinc-dependent metalloprotease [Rhodothermales bacterium]|nr:zinc-dependent metalloprotease [Rhodothermales bacterium]